MSIKKKSLKVFEKYVVPYLSFPVGKNDPVPRLSNITPESAELARNLKFEVSSTGVRFKLKNEIVLHVTVVNSTIGFLFETNRVVL